MSMDTDLNKALSNTLLTTSTGIDLLSVFPLIFPKRKVKIIEFVSLLQLFIYTFNPSNLFAQIINNSDTVEI